MRFLRSLHARLWLFSALVILLTLLFLAVAFTAQAGRTRTNLLYERLSRQARVVAPIAGRLLQGGYGLPTGQSRPRRVVFMSPDGQVLVDGRRPPFLPEAVVWKQGMDASSKWTTYRGVLQTVDGRRWAVAGISLRPEPTSPTSRGLILAVATPLVNAESVEQVYRQLRQDILGALPLVRDLLQSTEGTSGQARQRTPTLFLTWDGRILFSTMRVKDGGEEPARVQGWRWRPARNGAPGEFRGRIVGPDGHQWAVVAIPVLPPSSPGAEAVPLIGLAGPIQQEGLLAPILRPLILSGIFALFAGLLTTAFVTGWMTRSVDDLLQATQAIAQGNLDVQLDPERVPAEFGALVEGFNAMARQVKKTRQAQQAFVANVSHDLKTPLTSIRGFAQALKEGVASDRDAQQRAAEVIYEEAERMNRMVTQLLELAKMDAGQFALDLQPLHLDALLGRLVEHMRLRAQESDVRLAADLPPLPAVQGDPDRLAQVFTNLLENALKFTPAGGEVAVKARTETLAGQTWITISITDTGPGIPEEDLPHIFDRFYQVDKSRARGRGAGLGLSIVKELVEAHGGIVSVQSVQGLGTQFTVRLHATHDGYANGETRASSPGGAPGDHPHT